MTGVRDLDHQGVKWMGNIHSDWMRHPVKRHYQVQLGKMLQNEPSSPADRLVPYIKALHIGWGRVSTDDLPEMWASVSDLQQYGIADGDLLVCEGGEVGRAGIVKLPPPNCVIQNAAHRVRPKDSADVRFLLYVLSAVNTAGWFEVLCNRATIAHFTREKLAELRIPIPSTDAQRAIANFLDHETSRIDALIAKKHRQIELLQEKRIALISHFITKGLNARSKMTPSGIQWLGEIPTHWKVYRAKVLFREVNDRSTTGNEELLTVSHITGVTPRSEKDVNMFLAESLEGYKKCNPGDLVINTMWAWMGALGITPSAGIVSPSYNVYRFRSPAPVAKFYGHLFRIPRFVAEITRRSTGIWTSRLRLYPEEFFEIRLPVPPMEEQHEIVAAIEEETGNYDILEQRIEQSIEKLREYRLVLISSAVTGQVDLRQEVAV